MGKLASNFYLDLDTAEQFYNLPPDPSDNDLLCTVAEATEFASVSARQSEREAIDAVLGENTDHLSSSTRKVLAILRASMGDGVPPALSSDAWAICTNALRLLGALGAFANELDHPRAEWRTRRLEARIESGVDSEAIGLVAIDGVASGRAQKLINEGITTPDDVRAVGVSGLVDAGISRGVAETIDDRASALPRVSIEWPEIPDEIARGETR
ncbi:MAG: DEAD/DEAH box helicase, partial [Halobacteriaceae archaeon]